MVSVDPRDNRAEMEEEAKNLIQLRRENFCYFPANFLLPFERRKELLKSRDTRSVYDGTILFSNLSSPWLRIPMGSPCKKEYFLLTGCSKMNVKMCRLFTFKIWG